jgi:hypothetical protein
MTDADRIAQLERIVNTLVSVASLEKHHALCRWCGSFKTTKASHPDKDVGLCLNADCPASVLQEWQTWYAVETRAVSR